MLGQNGFRNDSAHTSGLHQSENRRGEMDNENNQIAHDQMVHGTSKTTEFRANLEFARDRLILLPFRLVGVVVTGVLDLIWTIITLPAVLVRKLAYRAHQGERAQV